MRRRRQKKQRILALAMASLMVTSNTMAYADDSASVQPSDSNAYGVDTAETVKDDETLYGEDSLKTYADVEEGGQVVTGSEVEVTEGDCDVRVNEGFTYCKLIPEKNARLFVFSRCEGDEDPYGTLFNAEKAELTSDDDGGQRDNFWIEYDLTAGETYYIGVRYYGSGTGVVPITIALADSDFTGFKTIGEDEFYFVDGQKGNQIWIEVDGKRHYINSAGKMAKNAMQQIYNSENGNYEYYRFDAEGNVVTGWYTTDNGYRYYYNENGVAPNNEFVTINGARYYFNYEGMAYTNTVQELYADGSYYYFAFDAEGKMVTGFYTTDNGELYYFDENGHGPSGMQQIEGDTYHLSDGYVSTDTTVMENDKIYYFGKDGKLEASMNKPTQDGVVEFRGSKYYVEDGEFVTNTWKQIDGEYFFFDSTGAIARNAFYDLADPETGEWKHFGFDGEGHLLNGWTANDQGDSNSCYYENGVFVDGFFTVDGATYYQNSTYNGIYKNQSFNVYDSEAQEYYYYADEDGKLVMGGMYTNEDGETYYCDEKGHMATGFVTLDGYTYYFERYGGMRRNTGFWTSDPEDGKSYNYRADEDGHLVTGLFVTSSGDEYYYDEKFHQVTGVVTIDGKKYLFNSNKQTWEGEDSIYDSEIGGYHYVRMGKNGVLVTGWYTQNGERYYYDEETAYSASGLTKIGEDTYYFEDTGRAYTDDVVPVEQKLYYFDKEGKLAESVDLTEGAITFQGCTYFVENGALVKDAWREIAGKKHYFGSDGRMVTSATTRVYDNETGKSFTYRFDENGDVVTGWYQAKDEGDNVWYYYDEEGRSMTSGFAEVDGKTYYFSSNGQMLADTTISEYDSEAGKSFYYRLDKKGQVVKGWYQSGSTWYYYDENGHAADGLTTIDGKTYYFDYQGRMYANTMVNAYDEETGEDYYLRVDKNGRLVTGWYKDTSYNKEVSWYYYGEDGHAATGFTEIDGVTYYFEYNGCMATEKIVVENGKIYYFDKDGKLAESKDLTEGWMDFYGSRYYVENGSLVTGSWKTIGEVTYYFENDGKMAAGKALELRDRDSYNYHTYRFDADGLVVKGWYDAEDGTRYYYDPTTGAATEGMLELDGVHYYFADDGRMIANLDAVAIAEGYNEVVVQNGAAYVKYVPEKDSLAVIYSRGGRSSHGELYDAQMNLLVSQRYTGYTENNFLLGYKVEAGKTYYLYVDAGSYSGIVPVSLLSVVEDGWQEILGDWYYVKDGSFVNGWQTIDEKKYYFFSGRMASNLQLGLYEEDEQGTGRHVSYRFNAKGTLVTGWYKNGAGDWYYYDEDGRSAFGVTTIGETTYYFDEDGRMLKKYTYADEKKLYYFGVKGNLEQTADLTEGWVEFHQNRYYVEEGALVRGSLKTIEGTTYYFDSDGIMLKNGTTSVYEEEGNDSVEHYYRFDNEGKMVKGWYETGAGKKYYYDETTGVAASGVTVLGAATYDFSYDGQMWTDSVNLGEEGFQYFGKDGKLEETQAYVDGWNQYRGTWYYRENGNFVNGLKKIDNKVYYLEPDMLVNTTRQVYDNGNYYYFRFDESGAAVKGWYQTEDGSWYYYDASCHAVSGMVKVKDVYYCFERNGRMDTNYVYQADDKLYYFGDDGALAEEKKLTNGWVQFKDAWYYVADGELVTGRALAIDGKTYYFNYNGKLAVSTTFSGSVNNQYGYYRTDANGVIVKGWYKENSTNNWYYYDENGCAVSGIVEIDGKTYNFSYNGRMYVNTTTNDGEKLYWFGNNGELKEMLDYTTRKGWFQFNDGWYYAEDYALASGFKTIGGKTYYFSPEMAENCTWTMYDEALERECTYRFNKDGVMVTGWYEDYGNWYYYDSTGRAANGITKVNGKTYCFTDEGRMLKNETTHDEDKFYFFGVDGELETSKNITSGWNKFKGQWYYCEAGELVNGFKTIDGKTYYFGEYMYTDTTIEIYDDDLERNCYYRVDADGVLVTGWYETGNGNRYYYDESGRAPQEGIKVVDDKTYYFYSDGQMATRIVANDEKTIYYFGKDGTIEDSKALATGWFTFHDKQYYVDAKGQLVDGVVEIEGKHYYFISNALEANLDENVVTAGDNDVVVKGGTTYSKFVPEESGVIFVYSSGSDDTYGELYDENMNQLASNDDGGIGNNYLYTYSVKAGKTYYVGTRCYFNGSGVIPVTIEYAKGSGWKKVNFQWYYLENGTLARGWKKVDGKWYYFGNAMCANTTAQLYDNNNYYYFRFNGDGNMVKGWYKATDGEWYYYDASGHAVSGLKTIDGKQYYFNYNGKMNKNTQYQDGTTVYVIGDDGVVSETKNFAEGWNQSGDAWYYVEDGNLVTYWKTIGGKKYYFGSTGKMLADTTLTEWKDAGRKSYRFKKDGSAYTNTWYMGSDGEWYYFGADSVAYTGVRAVSGKNYAFSESGVLLKDTIYETDGVTYQVDANGIATAVSSGWINAGKSWAYVENGTRVYQGLRTIDGSMYFFSDGWMTTDRIVCDDQNNVYYAVTESGKVRKTTGWYAFEGAWYYINEDATLAQGVVTDGGKQYYFAPAMAANVEYVADVENEAAYTVAADGALTALTASGMYANKNGVFAVADGKLLVKAWKDFNGNTYYFNEYGNRCTGAVVIDAKYYYFDAEGRLVKNTWIREGSKMYHADADGVLSTGSQKVDGVDCVFKATGELLNGVAAYHGAYHVYKDGASQGSFSEEGWNKAGNDYYYVLNGVVVASRALVLSDGTYVFGSTGIMQSGAMAYAGGYYYWVGANGKAKTGWIKNGGAWYYGDADSGKLVRNAEKKIDGKEYYFDDSCRMVTTSVIRNGMVYNYGTDGVLTGTTAISDGWSYSDGKCYYYKNGKAYTGWMGDYYVSDGVLKYNSVIHDGKAYYYLNGGGKYVQNQWIKEGNSDTGSFYSLSSYVYAKENGVLACDEWLEVGGKTYYFAGINMVTGVVEIDDAQYLFAPSGELIEKITGTSTGWKKKNGKYYYTVLGEYAVNQTLLIDGKWYTFDYNGVMQTSKLEGRYYYGSDGARQDVKGWKQINSKWYYFGDNGCYEDGWQQIDGKWYYFNYGMVTGCKCIGGRLYEFEKNGALKGEITQKDGWYQSGSTWYYFENSRVVTSATKIIDGCMYYFNSDGTMAANTIVYAGGCYRYANASGIIVTKEGWVKTPAGGYVYVLAGGKLATGVHKIKGTAYYFDYEGNWLE